jgi:hypothetical protein
MSMKIAKAFIKFVPIAVACCLILASSGCSLLNHVDKDKALDVYNGVIQNAGKATLTKSIFLKGDRKFGADSYVGIYKADYKKLTGTEYLFGNTSIERKSGKYVTVTCTFDVADGTANTSSSALVQNIRISNKLYLCRQPSIQPASYISGNCFT